MVYKIERVKQVSSDIYLPVILVFFRVDKDTTHERGPVCDVYIKIVMNLRKYSILGLLLNCRDWSDMFTNWIDQEKRLITMYMFNYSRDHFGNQEQVFEVDFFSIHDMLFKFSKQTYSINEDEVRWYMFSYILF